MNTKALRQKVLDLAIHGKLVPQNPNDESAEVLLKKIREEKAEKIKKGELKADKKDSFIFVGSDKRHYEQFADGTVKDIEDEIPFEVPEGWAWCRLGAICQIKTGALDANAQTESGTYPFFTCGEEVFKTDTFAFDCNAILLGGNNATGDFKMHLFNGKFNAYQRVYVISPFCKEYFTNWLFYNIKSYLPKFKEASIGSQTRYLKLGMIANMLIPFPPLLEQQTIVNSIDNILKQIAFVEQNRNDLKTTIKQAKSKILDLAIHGKLVPQDPNDEPAEELLKRIATSDNRPYEKLEENEYPFEIPDTWCWSKLGDICDYGKCISVNTNQLKADDWILDLEDIEKDTGRIIAFHTFEDRQSESTKHKFSKGQVLYSKLRPYLNKVVIAPKDGFCTSEILPLDFNGFLIPAFAQLLLMSSYFLDMVNSVTYGVKMPRLGTTDAKKMLIPIPPLEEQKKIVNQVYNMNLQLDEIILNLI